MRGLRLTLVATIAVVGLIVGADPASAAVTTNTSALGAGYKSVPPEGLTKATVTFKVPDVTCAHDNDFEPLYLGVFALNASDLVTLSAYVQASCNLGSKVYFANVNNGLTSQQMGVAIGDTVMARVIENGTTSKVVVKNITAQTSISLSKAAGNDPAVLIGDFGAPVVPTFTSIHMVQATVNGVAIGDAPATNRERLKFGSNVQIAASLVSSGKAGFNLVFKANQ